MVKNNFELTWKINWLGSQTYDEPGSHSLGGVPLKDINSPKVNV
jgi:hypothetical protein